MLQDAQLRFDMTEHEALRRELLLRMAVQNVTLIGAILIAGVGLVLQIRSADAAGAFALATCVTVALLVLIWCHQGARQAQIKDYLLILERRYSTSSGWETWLPTHPVGGVLGSRWFISTKGVFMAAMLAPCTAGFILDEMEPNILATSAACLISASAIALLLSNPKERLTAA